MIEAVLFDFGGIYSRSPFDALRRAGEELGIDGELTLSLCFGSYDEDNDHAWHRLERGELTIEDARTELIAAAAEAGHDLDPFKLLMGSLAGDDDQRDEMVERTRAIKARGLRTALVTNNVKEFGEGWRKLIPVDELFDVTIDSSAVGVRKPNPEIFALTLAELGGVPPDQAVLVDDALGNIAAARAFGMHGVLAGENRLAAMDELEALLG